MKTDNRTRLLNMARGHEDKVLVCRVLYTLCAVAVGEAEAAGMTWTENEQTAVYPSMPNAVQDVWEAYHGEEATDNVPHFVASFITDTDEEITKALATRPCLVNYGGTLHAMNTDRHGTPAIILRDMRSHTQA
jgi:hypothetical protein